MSIPSQPQIPILDPMLKLAYSSFGYDQTVLAPAKNGQIVSEWRNADLALSHSREYQLELARNDIAVACGIPSKGLCAIRFTTKDRLNAFLDSNPALRETLATSSQDGFHLWLRVTNFCPCSCRFTDLEWISDGNIIVLTRSGHQCRIDNQGKPISLDFEQLVWPTEVKRAFRREAISRKFPIAVKDRRGRGIANDNFIAAFYALDHPLYYDPSERQFYSDDQPATKLYPEMVKSNLLHFLAHIASVYAKTTCWLDTSLEHVNQLFEVLKVMCVRAPASQDVAIERFVEAQLTPAVGHDVSVGETYTHYVEYCEEKKLPAFALRQFQDRIALAIKRQYGLPKNHAIKRNGRCVRGFRGLGVRGKSEMADTQDGQDGADVVDAKMDSSIIYMSDFNASPILS